MEHAPGYAVVKLKRVLILHKKSTYQIQALEHKDERFVALLERGNATVARVKIAHEEHYETLEKLEIALKDRQIAFEAISRMEHDGIVEDCDLLISVGGDGTFLDASHKLIDVPLLGINSSKSSSFGHYCIGNEKNLETLLDSIASGHLEPLRLVRLQLTLNGRPLPEKVLNEVLICHNNPAGTSRYFIEVRGKREEHKSSGIWIGPAGGSTAAIRSAGGQVLPVYARQFQYVVREPWPRPSENWELTKGILDEDEEMRVISHMRMGALYIDGSHIQYRFALGDELEIRRSSHDLIAFVSRDANSIFDAPTNVVQ